MLAQDPGVPAIPPKPREAEKLTSDGGDHTYPQNLLSTARKNVPTNPLPLPLPSPRQTPRVLHPVARHDIQEQQGPIDNKVRGTSQFHT